ncbi:3-oxoacyl-[acyl-carrier-protein] synthase II [Amycolatopsis bartoniae]|uniref:3-oxoacyl-[acyl-carrier-protein] synthase 2 n=1 Tax=Amycolatopsis bartoniae TaxID=941986 RepID=A0A8H9IXY7_9PSEU|nr:beta-ketoacyl synthase N-terminal-like domain-containing protein [Amycolatopsis bartoniae]MBB2935262.1 3-oxoacyl-[acyl-carrier-protein] synthase II [Amycolatopsis bartoniae]TVT06827.1 3-oxoacyl-ACP synthase [Amycolatopsis bartoniae]GHF55578.1 3-oxoacyl-[acyl-carrier-protein] synthase 2 [Amycolatopsis bartoniae]
MSARATGICGIGAVTGYGWGREVLWEGLISGKAAAGLHGGYGAGENETALVAKVPDGGNPADGTSRFARAMRAAAREAIADAEQRGWHPGRRVGLLHAVVLGEVDLWREFYLQRQTLKSRDYLALMPSTPMSTFMQEYGFHGPAMNVSAMCASGNAGLLTAKAWLDGGIVDDVVFVATDLSLVPENVLHFERLGVAITDAEPLDACRPFQEGSRGFSMGEASVSFVLSKNAERPYALALGGAMSHDAHHVTSIDPSLQEIRGCFRDALANAGVPAAAVRYLNAHGPGTAQCDRAEATILEELFEPETRIYSVKPLVGHCQGAASAVETAVAALGYDRGCIPAPPAVAPGHPQLLNGKTPVEDGLTVKSSLGMGGHNSVVVLAPPA